MFILVVKVLLQVGHEVGLRDYNDKIQSKVPRNKDILLLLEAGYRYQIDQYLHFIRDRYHSHPGKNMISRGGKYQ